MRLPQDYILHIKSAKDGIHITAEWQGELVRCKDCRHGWYDDDIEYYVCRHPKGLNEELYGVDFCSYGERREP